MGTECPDAVGVRVYCVNSSSGDVLSQHFDEKSGFLDETTKQQLKQQREALKSLHWVACGTLRPFEGSPTCRASRGPLAHTFNYFVMSCPILRSFSLLSFRNKFSLKITKHALE